MPQLLKLAVSQSHTLATTSETLDALESTTKEAAQRGARLILFPEAYLGGYPRGCSFGAAVGSRDPIGREQFLHYFNDAVDLGDTPAGAGDAWVERKLPIARGEEYRGDGVREELERISRETGVFIVTGLVERSGGSLYCSCVYVCPRFGVLGKRRKVMPTGSERLVWAQGSPSTLKAVTTTIDGVKLTLAAAICWENYMPLLRQSLYAQNVNLYLAPTADARDAWLSLMRTVGCEGRAFVLSANQCTQRKDLPIWVQGNQERHSESRRKDVANSATRPTPLGRRRTSTITLLEDGHELCLPLRDGKAHSNGGAISPPQANGHSAAVSTIDEDDDVTPPRSPRTYSRRKSIITQTTDQHEICWPPPHGSATTTTKRKSTSSDVEHPLEDGEEYLCRGGSSIISPSGDVLAGPLWESSDLLIVECDFEDCIRGRLDLDVGGSYSRSDGFKLTVEGLDLAPPP